MDHLFTRILASAGVVVLLGVLLLLCLCCVECLISLSFVHFLLYVNHVGVVKLGVCLHCSVR